MILYLDCSSGVSGDMLASALCGVARRLEIDGDAVVTEALRSAGIDPGVVTLTEVKRGGLAAMRFEVAERPGFARLSDLEQAIAASRLPRPCAERVSAVVRRLAAAEVAAHGGDQPHVHELSGLDTAVDIVSVVALIDALAPCQIIASPPALGGGFVQSAHGRLPVPAPAVLALLEGLPTAGGEEDAGELTTPTGAALLAEFAGAFGPLPAGVIAASALGAGARELAGRPNALRAVAVQSQTPTAPAWSTEELVLLAATIDDMSAEYLADAAEAVRAAGALDAWLVPATMKKARPGAVLQALCTPARAAALVEVVFRQTTTFGVRAQRVERFVLQSEHRAVQIDGETVRVRFGRIDGQLVTVSPEHDDCARAGERLRVPARAVYERAQAAGRALFDAAQ